MNFSESEKYLLSLGNEVTAMKLGLENISKLLGALGDPQNNYLKVQIAGTNGKGSTVAFLEAICTAAKIKVGATTSPHLVSVTERIRIGGAEISEEDFARLATKVRETSEKLVENFHAQSSEQSKIQNLKSKICLETVPTYFEQVTAIALAAFAEAKVELAILETGLGGRYDATTAARAEIAAITPIDYDHQNILGNSLTEIAGEKAAIIREMMPVVLAKQKFEALKTIIERCADAKVVPCATDFPAEIVGIKNTKLTVDFQTEKAKYENVELSLPGRHQIENAKTAIRLAQILRNHFEISPGNVVEGLEKAVHKGRLELYRGILFDGAHNAGGAKALREFLDEFVNQPITLIFAAMRDKDLKEIAEILFPKAENLILTKAANPRSMDTSELMKFVPENFGGEVFQFQTIAGALEKARKTSSENHLILVTGSLYLVGEAQKALEK